MGKIELYFDDDDQVQTLIDFGYIIKPETVTYTVNEYHDRIRDINIDGALCIYRDVSNTMVKGKEKIPYDWGLSSTIYSQVNYFFARELSKRILKLI